MHYSRIYKDKLIYALLLSFFSFIFVFFFSRTTSPLYKYDVGIDSAYFQTMARGWINGKVLYRDIFDQKGPYLYTIEALGILLCNGRIGIMIMQIITFI